MFRLIPILLFICLGSTLVSCSSLSAVDDQFRGLDDYLTFIGKKQKAMGEIAILTNGKVVYQREYGFKEQAPQSIFRVGSISKVYTAVLIMKEIEKGTLSLDTKLNKYYPEFKNSKKITIEHLLRHRSGFVNFTSLRNYFDFAFNPQSERDLIKMFKKNGFDFKPGKKFKYSNTGYVLLSFILEKIHGKPYAAILEKEITAPLGLVDTYVFEKEKPRAREVLSYEMGGEWALSTKTHQSVPLGAGAIVATPNELALFLWTLFNGKILKPSTVKKMKGLIESYGLGIFSVPYNDKIGFGHTGGIDGFASIGFHFSDSDTVVVNLTNAMDMNMNDISLATLASVYGDAIKMPVFEDVLVLPTEKLELFQGLYKSKEFPLDIKIFVLKDKLFAQATGQGKFNLSAVSEDTFVFKAASLRIKFNTALNELHITQGGKTSVLNRAQP